MSLGEWAHDVAERYLAASLPSQWQHAQDTAVRARGLVALVGPDADLLVAAAYLHPVGASPELAGSGYERLEMGRYLCDEETYDRLVRLIATRSCMLFAAAEYGVDAAVLAEFPPEDSPTADALWYADLTTGDTGGRCTVDERLAALVTARPGVEPFLDAERAGLLASVARTKARLRAAG